jgi:hypothetical protein
MASVEQHLRRWLDARLLDEAAAARIREYERETAPAEGRPGVLEVLVYLGLAVAAAGAVILVSTSWDELRDWARVAVLVVPGLLALALGWGLKASGSPGTHRGGHIALLVGGAMLAGAAAVLSDNAGEEARDNALAAGLVGVALALALWALSPSHPQVVGVGAAFVVLALSLAERPDEFSFAVGGLFLAAAGAAGMVLAELGWLQPQVSARALAGGGVAFGAFFAGFDEGAVEAAALLAGLALVLAGIARGTLVYVAEGVGAVFAGLVASITRHVDDAATAALLLMVIGAGLLATVLLLAFLRPWAREAAT